MFDTLLRGLRGRKSAPPKAHVPTTFRPQLEVLEDRMVPAAIRDLTGFRANIFLPNQFPPFPVPFPPTGIIQGGFTDDGSQGPVGLGFRINFYGIRTDNVFLNTNGNLTIGGPTAATAGLVNLPASGIPIIAPFFSDVNTLFVPSEPVTYGVDTIAGHNVFGVDWINVMYSAVAGSTQVRLNSFQLILIDRSDTGPGNFDLEFNYDKITWETADTDAGFFPSNGLGPRSAVAGFSDGTGAPGHYFLLPGSGAPGQLLDGGSHALSSHSLLASTPGRYHFLFRNGVPVSALPGLGVDLTPFLRELNPFRFVHNPRDDSFAGKFYYERRGGTFAAFLDNPALDEVGFQGINSTGPPITLVFNHLPPGVTVLNATGVTASGFQYLVLPSFSLPGKGSRFRVLLKLSNPNRVNLGTFFRGLQTEVFAGPFDPAAE